MSKETKTSKAGVKPKKAPGKSKSGVGGVRVGDTPPLRELHKMAMETSRALARDTNGNARQRASRRHRTRAV